MRLGACASSAEAQEDVRDKCESVERQTREQPRRRVDAISCPVQERHEEQQNGDPFHKAKRIRQMRRTPRDAIARSGNTTIIGDEVRHCARAPATQDP